MMELIRIIKHKLFGTYLTAREAVIIYRLERTFWKRKTLSLAANLFLSTRIEDIEAIFDSECIDYVVEQCKLINKERPVRDLNPRSPA